jgi:hypothetical protein
MSWGYYGILIIFAAFFLLLVLSPNLSCFGKKLKSPFYPLLRRKKTKKKIKAEDYGFSLVDAKERERAGKKKPEIAVQRRDSSLAKDGETKALEVKKKRLKTDDYGFSLDDDDK